MKIFKDAFTGDELFSDTYKMKLVDNVIWEVYGKHETRTEGEIKLEGSNESAEEPGEDGADPSSVSGIDIILNHRLQSTAFGTKKDYLTYLKLYMKKVTKHLEDNGKTDEVETFKTNINKVMGPIMKKFKDLEFYLGESQNFEDGMILILDYTEVDGEERPTFYAFKHGLEEEKV